VVAVPPLVFAAVLVRFLHDLGVLASATCFEQRRRFADRQRSGTGSPLGVFSRRGAMSSHMVVAVLAEPGRSEDFGTHDENGCDLSAGA